MRSAAKTSCDTTANDEDLEDQKNSGRLYHAGGKAVYVETTMDVILDLDDMEEKLRNTPDCKHVLVSHMRGKLADMASVKRICDRYGAILLEDCAHSLGVRYADIHSGHMGVACAISSQSYKMINSGEGGFLLTDNEGISQQEQETWKRLGS